jgi:ankyrin repeat protein
MALRLACWNGNLAEVQRLLAAGAPLEGRDKNHRTPLLMACHGGNAEVVKFLLQQGARADMVNGVGDTTIGQACEYGHLEAAKLVLAAGADVTRVNKWGRTPLMLASREGRDDVVAWLLTQHVDVSYHATSLPAIYYAVWTDRLAIATSLLAAGAKIEANLQPVGDFQHAYSYAQLAALTNDPKMIELVLAHGAQIDEKDFWGRDALMSACIYVKTAAVPCLLDHGAAIDATDEDGVTALMFSSMQSSVENTRLLIQHGAHLEARDKLGRTALTYAAQHTDDAQAAVLVDAKADVNATDSQGQTALAYAGDRGDAPLVSYLAGKGAKLTDVHILAKPASNPPLTPAQSWALAVGAIYVQRNGTNPHVLGYDANTDDPEEAKDELMHDWNVSNQIQLLKMLDQLKDPGDRKIAQKLGAQFALMVESGFEEVLHEENTNPKRNNALRATRRNYIKWKDSSGLAFDVARRAHMICMGYDAGYIAADQAWPLLLENARLAQAGFHSGRSSATTSSTAAKPARASATRNWATACNCFRIPRNRTIRGISCRGIPTWEAAAHLQLRQTRQRRPLLPQ